MAYRLLNNRSIIFPRSFCPECKEAIAWYDLIPVISWLILKAKCRNCKKNISILYPFIEIFTAIVFTAAIFLIEPKLWIPYFIFFSALIITIRTDLEQMLISRYATLYLIPVAFLFSFFNLLEISFYQSFMGAVIGYFSLWIIAKLFVLVRKKEGIGEGDFELLAMIGAFLSVTGVWFTIFFGSIFGSILGIILILRKYQISKIKIPFGPFLAFGAIIYAFFNKQILNYFLSYY